MKITQEHSNTLILAGTPGGAVWMVVMIAIGGAIGAVSGGIAWQIASNDGLSGLAWQAIPLGLGVLIGLALMITGIVTLTVGKQRLALDKVTGKGKYTAVPPIVDVGKPCEFELRFAKRVVIERQTEDHPSTTHAGPMEATVYRAVLRVTKPRRSIVLDETENQQEVRVNEIAESVASFLGLTVEHPG